MPMVQLGWESLVVLIPEVLILIHDATSEWLQTVLFAATFGHPEQIIRAGVYVLGTAIVLVCVHLNIFMSVQRHLRPYYTV